MNMQDSKFIACVSLGRQINSLTHLHTHTDLWAMIHISLDQPYMQLCYKEPAGCHSVHMLMHEYNTL
jgi:hypothetical protein